MTTSESGSSRIYQHLPETNDGTVTSWMPITTSWPSTFGCAESIWSYASGNMLAAWDPGYGLSVEKGLRCWPPEGTSWWDSARLGANSKTDVSIGPITCPQAYYTATASPKDERSTLVACCPSGYTFAKFLKAGGIGECVSDLSSGQVITYVTRNDAQDWITTTTSVTTSTHMAGVQLNGWNFALDVLTPVTTNISHTATTPPFISDTHSAMGTGTKVGIGISVVAVLVLLAALGAFFVFRRKKRADSATYQRPQTYDNHPVELEAERFVPELVAKGPPLELRGPAPVYELPER